MLQQNEFEFAIYQCLSYGDELRLAQEAGKSPSYYSQLLNPSDPRESIFYRAAEDFINWRCKVNPEGGKRAYLTFCGFIEAAVAECEGDGSLESVHKESSEGVHAGIRNAPVDEQINEARDAIAAWASRLRELERQKSGKFIAPEPRSVTSTRITHNATREDAKQIVHQHRNNNGNKGKSR